MATKKRPDITMTITDNDMTDIMDIMSSSSSTPRVFSKNTLIDYSYSTGIPIIDYAFGYEVIVKNEHGQFIKKRVCKGLQAGSFNVVAGRTQSFKTLICEAIEASIGYRYNGNIVHYDAEGRLVLQRVKNTTKLPDSWFEGEHPRFALRAGAIGFDTLQKDITDIYEMKMKNRDKLLQNTGEVDHLNRPIYLMPPTVVLVDSLQNVIEKEFDINDVNNKKWLDDQKELRSNMYGAQSAKTIRGLLTDIVPLLKEANIILIAIAHKTTNMATNPFAGVRKQFQYGNNDERISGGSAVEFNASAVLNFSGLVKEEYRYHLDTDGFEGNTILFEPTKSSTSESGNEKSGKGFLIVVDKRNACVDNLRTLVLFLNSRGRLKGNKAGYRVVDKNGEVVSEKFTWKKIYEDLNKNNPDTFETYKKFMLVAKEELETLIAPAEDKAGQIDPFDMDSIIDSFSSDTTAA